MSVTTRWSLVLAARGDDGQARSALAALCAAYRPVILAHFRRRGDPGAAEDQTQAFFLHFLQCQLTLRADPGRGSFRAFLYAAAENHARGYWRQAQALKRGAGVLVELSLPGSLIEAEDGALDPAAQFDRDWALRVVARAAERLRAEAVQAGRQPLFDALAGHLVATPDDDDYARIAERFSMARPHVAVAIKRLRDRLRALVRRELADTLPADADVDAEMVWLRAALREPL